MKKQIPEQASRAASLRSADHDGLTIELSFSSETPVPRPFGDEVLSHEPGAVRLGRLRSAAPFLLNHSHNDQIDVIESVRIVDGTGRATIRFSRSKRGHELFQDVADGIRRNISVGYAIHDVKAESRAGQPDLVTVTDWEPLEISLVSVPADISVGIGRTANPGANKMTMTIEPIKNATARRQRGRRRTAKRVEHSDVISHRHLVEAAMKPGNGHVTALAETIEAARTAMPNNARIRDDGSAIIDKNMSSIAATRAQLDLTSDLKPIFGSQGTGRQELVARAGESRMIPNALLGNSRVMQAGAALIQMPRDVSGNNNGVPVFRQIPSGYVVVDPAYFTKGSVVDDEVVLPEGDIPANRADADLDTTTEWGFRVKIPRSMRRQYGVRQVAAELFTSIALGIAHVADRELLGTISAETLDDFSVANVATSGADYDDLLALIGTDANGAAITDDGRLMATAGGARVPAWLTADMSSTIAGNWSRAALAVDGNIDLLLERTDASGGLVVTCRMNVQSLVPTTSQFWKIEA